MQGPCIQCIHAFAMHYIYVSVSVQAQDLVSCHSSVGCDNEIGVTTARECCVENPDGLAYTIPGQEICTPCVGKFINRLQVQDACMD